MNTSTNIILIIFATMFITSCFGPFGNLNKKNKSKLSSNACLKNGSIEYRKMFLEEESLSCQEETQKRVCSSKKWSSWNGSYSYKTCKTVVVANNFPIAAILSPANNISIIQGEAVSFSSSSTDPDGDLLSYIWSFGSGSGINSSVLKDPGAIVFNSVGTFMVSLMVQDIKGLFSQLPAVVQVTVSAAPNRAPSANITGPVNNITINQGGFVSFLSSATDPDGDLLSYLWSFGAGSGLNNSLVQNPGSLQFNNLGIFVIQLVVSDNQGLSDSTPPTVTISVVSAPNNPPNASIISPNNSITISVGQSVSFNSSASDPDGDLMSYLWNFGSGSGISNASVQNPGSLVFSTVGTFNVSLIVTDSKGLADPTPATTTVIVNNAPNNPPVSSIVTPNNNVTIYQGQTVNFNSSATDPDGDAINYSWNFGAGSGISSSNLQNPGDIIFNNLGTFTIILSVVDILGNSDLTPPSIQVTVEENFVPVISNGLPTGNLEMGITQTSLSLNTNEKSTCRYSTNNGVSYSAMTNSFTADASGLTHQILLTGLVNGSNNTYFIRCSDEIGMVTTSDYIVFFTISNGDLRISWNKNAPLEFVKGYKIYFGTDQNYNGNCTINGQTSPIDKKVSELADPENPSIMLGDVKIEGCFVTITAYNQIGESQKSIEGFGIPK